VVLPLLFFLVSLLVPLSSSAQQSDRDPYLTQLIAQANQEKLANQREWHLLLHYQKGIFGGYESEQDDPGFFMSANGKTDPAAELAATLAQFFSAELVARSRQPAQCAFIARYHWLKEQLKFDPTR
jgi:hypothetical protein